jgi:hypothetical protein
MTKLYIGGFLLIVFALAGWQYTRMAAENGQLEQANSTLAQTVKDKEKANKTLKLAAAKDAAIVAKAERSKSKLRIKAVKLRSEIEVLKYENANVKKWAIIIMPGVLSDRLLTFSSKDNGDRLPETTDGINGRNTSSIFRVRNENLYNFTGELIAALQSCNKDKAGLREWAANIPGLPN